MSGNWSAILGFAVLLLPLLIPLTLYSPSFAPQEIEIAHPQATYDKSSGIVALSDGEQALLHYRATSVPLPDGYLDQIAEGNRIYAKPRSGYLHPLYGLDGEELTLDWSIDHPHHRAIYWAWPEVQVGKNTGDLHALQKIYSRPVGEPETIATKEYARVKAKNLWLWDDLDAVVMEQVVITAFAIQEDGMRVIDLELRFEALAEDVSLARRGTNLYGGLNVRLAPVEGLGFDRQTQAPRAATPATPGALAHAWSTTTGVWKGGKQLTTLAILEYPLNPESPADFVTYEELPWFQPTFPRAGSRYALKRGEPLSLRYRFLIFPGAANASVIAKACNKFAITVPVLPIPQDADHGTKQAAKQDHSQQQSHSQESKR
ncbi:MAG: hypothetical protein GY747_05335 [Planctomycetes bacterium]|nr:hypothetical protein [Planctomycetota bacterium]MCP4770358.1 hypothetical protein [Planctomycetota bacterium]MCP4861961.1 hypothetical protein [Planctomycetota bacterium]